MYQTERELYLKRLRESSPDIDLSGLDEFKGQGEELTDEDLPWQLRKAPHKAVRYCFALIKQMDMSKDEAKAHYGDFTHANLGEIKEMIRQMELDSGTTSEEYHAKQDDLAWTFEDGFNLIDGVIARCYDCIHCKQGVSEGECVKFHIKNIRPNKTYPLYKNCFESRYGRLTIK